MRHHGDHPGGSLSIDLETSPTTSSSFREPPRNIFDDKKLAKNYDAFLASKSLIKQIPSQGKWLAFHECRRFEKVEQAKEDRQEIGQEIRYFPCF